MLRHVFDAFDVSLRTVVLFGTMIVPLGLLAANQVDRDVRVVPSEALAGPQVEQWMDLDSASMYVDVAEPEPEPEPVEVTEPTEPAEPTEPLLADVETTPTTEGGPQVTVTRSSRPAVRSMPRTRTAMAVVKPSGGNKGRSRKCIEPVPEIRKVSADAWEVDRKLVDYYATHIKALDALGWAATHKNDLGRTDGFKVGGMRCGNALRQGGLQNGDVVHTVNGRAVKNIPQAIAAYLTLRRAKTIELEITRKGERKKLRYRLT